MELPIEKSEYDFTTAAGRRAFFLSRGRRRGAPSRGSDYEALMRLPRRAPAVNLDALFADVRYAVIGGVATRSYMPERSTQDIDVLVDGNCIAAAREALQGGGCARTGDLMFPGSLLGLLGETWSTSSGYPIDLIWTTQRWVADALESRVRDGEQLWIVPLWALIGLKLDASRTIDQGDLGRMLGLANDDSLREVRRNVPMMLTGIEDDLESYIQLGRLEVGRSPK